MSNTSTWILHSATLIAEYSMQNLPQALSCFWLIEVRWEKHQRPPPHPVVWTTMNYPGGHTQNPHWPSDQSAFKHLSITAESYTCDSILGEERTDGFCSIIVCIYGLLHHWFISYIEQYLPSQNITDLVCDWSFVSNHIGILEIELVKIVSYYERLFNPAWYHTKNTKQVIFPTYVTCTRCRLWLRWLNREGPWLWSLDDQVSLESGTIRSADLISFPFLRLFLKITVY